MKVIIDRFEGDHAIVELDGEMYKADRALFACACEGDTIELTNLGKPSPEEDSSPHTLFQKLRKKRNRHPRNDDKEPV